MQQPANVRRFLFFKTHRLMTIKSVDDDALARELTARGITCEVPRCEQLAVAVIKSGMASFLCAGHREIHDMSKLYQRTIEGAIRAHVQLVMSQTAHAAYESSVDEVLFKYEGEGILQQAQIAMDVLEKTDSNYRRRKEAERKAAGLARLRELSKKQAEQKKNPVLADIDETNKEEPMIDIFSL